VRQRSALVGEAIEDTWVLGPEYSRLQSENERADLERKVEELYLADYARVWNAFIQDIDVVAAHNVEQQADIVRSFAQTDSPIKSVLQPIAAQTALARALSLAEIQTTSPDELQRWRDRVERWFGPETASGAPAAGVDPAARVDGEFAALHALVQSEDDAPPPIDAVLASLNDLHDYLLEVQQMGTQGQAALDSFSETVSRGRAVLVQIESLAKAQPEPLRSWLHSLATTSSALARGEVRAGAQARLKEEWATAIAPECRKALTGRYPFVRTASEAVNLVDFARLFGPGGLIETFARERVLPFADTSVRPWQWRSGDEGAIGLSSGSLRMFENASRIREAFFATAGASPGVFFEVEPLMLDSKARQVVLEIGEQRIVYQHGPRRSQRVQWPPAQGTGARIVFTPAEQIGQTLTLAKSGPWALFQLLDEARVQRGGSVDRFQVSFAVRGYQADFMIRAESVANPFTLPELHEFRCLDRL
jgi:type VI secretion system protein ImpL